MTGDEETTQRPMLNEHTTTTSRERETAAGNEERPAPVSSLQGRGTETKELRSL